MAADGHSRRGLTHVVPWSSSSPTSASQPSALHIRRIVPIRLLLTDRAVLLLDHMLDLARLSHLSALLLCFGLRLRSVRRDGVALRTVLPDPVLVVRLDISLGHGASPPFQNHSRPDSTHRGRILLRAGTAWRLTVR